MHSHQLAQGSYLGPPSSIPSWTTYNSGYFQGQGLGEDRGVMNAMELHAKICNGV